MAERTVEGDENAGAIGTADVSGSSGQPPLYQADGTVYVHYGPDKKVKAVTFIPDGADKCVFLLHDDNANDNKSQPARVVKAKKVILNGKFENELLMESLRQAAIKNLKVTILVSSSCDGTLDLEEAIIPAIPTG